MRHHGSIALLGLALLTWGCKGDLIEPDLGGSGNPNSSATPALAIRIGGLGAEDVTALASDAQGNAYLAGNFIGTVDFDPGTGVTTLSSLGGSDGFVAKYSSTGSLVWVSRIGGTGAQTVTSMVVDRFDNVIVGGGYEGAVDLDPGPGNYYLASSGGEDGFVVKLASDGAFIWGRRLGGGQGDRVEGVAADALGNIYAAGFVTGSANMLPDFGPVVVSTGDSDGFLASWDATGSVRWATAMGGNGPDQALAVGLTGTGLVAVSGNFTGTADFAPGTAITTLTSIGGTEVFVAGYAPDGGLAWARAISGTGEQVTGRGGMAVDPAAGIVVTGSFEGTVDLDPGAGTAAKTSIGSNDWFIARLDPSGNYLSSFSLGGPGTDPAAPRPAFDDAHNLLLVGSFTGTADFDPETGTRYLTSFATAGSDAFVGSYTVTGSLLWVSRYGEATGVSGRNTAGVAAVQGGTGGYLTAGRFYGSPDFDPGTTTFRMVSQGETDVFLVKLTSTGALAPAP